MAPNVDPAILEALGLDAESTQMSSHGGSGFSSTFNLTSTKDGEEVHYFVKTGSGKDAEVMFRGQPSPVLARLRLPSGVLLTKLVPRRARVAKRHPRGRAQLLPGIPRPRQVEILLGSILHGNGFPGYWILRARGIGALAGREAREDAYYAGSCAGGVRQAYVWVPGADVLRCNGAG